MSRSTLLVVLVFGWTGGKQLVGSSYVDAKEKVAEQRAQRAEKREQKRSQREGGLRRRFRRGNEEPGDS